jgi:hypothetical protein
VATGKAVGVEPEVARARDLERKLVVLSSTLSHENLEAVEWDDAGRTRKVPINEWIQHAVKGSTMPSGPWIYGGSLVHEGRFAAEVTGDIAAIFITNSALINYPVDDNRDDTVWLVYPKRVPAYGTNVTVIIAPHQDAKPIPEK